MRRVVVQSFLKDTSIAESRPYLTLTESRPGGVGAPGVLYLMVYATGNPASPSMIR